MKARSKKIVAAALVCIAALVFVGAAVAMPAIEVSSGSASSGTVVRPDDRAGVRGPAVVSHGIAAVKLSPRPFGRGAHTIRVSDVQAPSTGSDVSTKTIGISAGALALALCLAGLAVAAKRQRKAQLGF